MRSRRRAIRAASPKGFVASLAVMNDIAGPCEPGREPIRLDERRGPQKELPFLGADNIANRSAVDNLIAMGEQQGRDGRLPRYGAKSGLERLLPGVKVHVLGPPDLDADRGHPQDALERSGPVLASVRRRRIAAGGGARHGPLGAGSSERRPCRSGGALVPRSSPDA